MKIPRRDIDGVGCQSGGHKREGDEGRMLGWKFATVSWSGAGGVDVDPGRRSPRCHETCLVGVYHLQLGLLLLHRNV